MKKMLCRNNNNYSDKFDSFHEERIYINSTSFSEVNSQGDFTKINNINYIVNNNYSIYNENNIIQKNNKPESDKKTNNMSIFHTKEKQRQLSLNYKVNKRIKIAFCETIFNHGIDFINPDKTAEYLKEILTKKEVDFDYDNCKKLIVTFIFFITHPDLVDVALDFYNIEKSFLEILIQKKMFEIGFLGNTSMSKYKDNSELIHKNINLIFNEIKNAQVGGEVDFHLIHDERSKDNYKSNMRYHWYSNFVQHIILKYLGDERIQSFSQFLCGLTDMEIIIKNFDADYRYDFFYLYLLYDDENEFYEKLNFIVNRIINKVCKEE